MLMADTCYRGRIEQRLCLTTAAQTSKIFSDKLQVPALSSTSKQLYDGTTCCLSGGFKGVTRKLRTSLGFGDKDKEKEAPAEAPEHPPDLSTHVSFNDRVEELPVAGGTQ